MGNGYGHISLYTWIEHSKKKERMNESYVLSNLQETQLPKVENGCSMGWHGMSNRGERKKVREERKSQKEIDWQS